MEYERYVKALDAVNQIPSVLTVSAQELIDRYAGTGIITQGRDDTVKEIIKSNETVGKFWNNQLRHWASTEWFTIIYSKKKGTHVYPIYGGDK